MLRALSIVILLAAASAAHAQPALDFDVAHTGTSYVVRDDAYQVTFPVKPQVKAMQSKRADGTMGDSVIASGDAGDVGYTATFTPVPRNAPYPMKAGLDAARDGALTAISAKLTSESSTKLGGRDGRRVLATAVFEGKTMFLDIRMAWDPEHRTLVSLLVVTPTRDQPPAVAAFFSSLAIAKGTKDPLDPALPAEGAPVKTGVGSLEVVRKKDTYTVHDGVYQIAFPVRPEIKPIEAKPLTGFSADGYGDEVEYFALFAMTAPADVDYDADKGIEGARDGMLKVIEGQSRDEKKATIAGLPGRRIVVSGKFRGLPVHGEADMVWDAKHRTLLAAFALTKQGALTPAAHAFLASFAIKH